MGNLRITVPIFLFVCSIFSSCGIFLPPTTCGIHTRKAYHPDGYHYVVDYFVATKRKPFSEKYVGKKELTLRFPAEKYCLYYYHCNQAEPYDIQIEVYAKREDKVEQIICTLDCSRSKKGYKIFKVDQPGKYYCRVVANEKLWVWFGVAGKIQKRKE